MTFEGIGYMAMVLTIEYILASPRLLQIFARTPQVQDPPAEDDSDVVAVSCRGAGAGFATEVSEFLIPDRAGKATSALWRG